MHSVVFFSIYFSSDWLISSDLSEFTHCFFHLLKLAVLSSLMQLLMVVWISFSFLLGALYSIFLLTFSLPHILFSYSFPFSYLYFLGVCQAPLKQLKVTCLSAHIFLHQLLKVV